MKRRLFIQNSLATLGGLALAQSVAGSVFKNSPAPHPIGIQLFTVMNELDADLTGTLKKIASLGYKEIESAFSMKGGYYGLKPKEFASLVKDLGLSWKSHHVLGAPFVPPPDMKLPESFSKMVTLKDGHQQLVDEAVEGGFQYLVCANTPIGTTEEIN
jgi:sugar phosphate isomerase/epimerase